MLKRQNHEGQSLFSGFMGPTYRSKEIITIQPKHPTNFYMWVPLMDGENNTPIEWLGFGKRKNLAEIAEEDGSIHQWTLKQGPPVISYLQRWAPLMDATIFFPYLSKALSTQPFNRRVVFSIHHWDPYIKIDWMFGLYCDDLFGLTGGPHYRSIERLCPSWLCPFNPLVGNRPTFGLYYGDRFRFSAGPFFFLVLLLLS